MPKVAYVHIEIRKRFVTPPQRPVPLCEPALDVAFTLPMSPRQQFTATPDRTQIK